MFDNLLLLYALIPIILIPGILGSYLPAAHVVFPIRWWFGILVIGLTVMICHALETNPLLPFLLIALLLCPRFLHWFGSRAFEKLSSPKNFLARPSRAEATAALVLLTMWFSAWLFVLTHPVDPYYADAVTIWYRKARNIFYWVPIREDGSALKTYPHLGSVLQMYVMRWMGKEPLEGYGRLIYPSFFFMWIFSFRVLWHERFEPWLHGLFVILALALFHLPHFTNGYQDGFLSMAVGISALCFVKLFLEDFVSKTAGQAGSQTSAWLFLAFFFAGSLCFIKLEGTTWAFILLISAGMTCFLFQRAQLNKQTIKQILPFLALFSVLLILWPLLLRFNQVDLKKIQADAYSTRDMLTWYKNMDRWQVIQPYYFAYWKKNLLLVLPGLFLSALSYFLAPKSRKAIFFLWMVFLSHSLFVLLPFFATRLPLEWHIQNALSRLLFQQLFLYGTWIALSVSSLAALRAGQHSPSNK